MYYRIVLIEEIATDDLKHVIYQIKIDKLESGGSVGLWVHVYDEKENKYNPATQLQCQDIIQNSFYHQAGEFYRELDSLYGDFLTQLEFYVVKPPENTIA